MADSPDGSTATFELRDRNRRLNAVRLVQEVGLPGPLELARAGATWRLELTPPDVARMEYLYEIEDRNGNRTTITDPDNPIRAGGAFGDKSVREFAGYQRPAWLDVEPVTADELELEVASAELDASVSVTMWAPHLLAHADPAPLLIVHDGPEYARLGAFTQYLGAAIATRALPPVRAALIDPGERNAWYAANPAYADALCGPVLAELADAAPASTARIGVGVSLGGLAMLHAHRRHPGVFDGLLLQSSSFFTPTLDPQESGFSGFAAVTGFVAQVQGASADPAPVPTVLTCGTVEENLANNEAMARELERLGYPARLVRVRDAHNYTAWRDALDPCLTRLVTEVVSAHAA